MSSFFIVLSKWADILSQKIFVTEPSQKFLIKDIAVVVFDEPFFPINEIVAYYYSSSLSKIAFSP
jgi:hypothetical protein